MKTARGFSILEILIAMVVILTAVTAVTLMAPGIQSVSVDAQMNIEALNMAQESIENEQALSRKDFKLVNSVATTTSGMFSTAIYASNIDLFTKKVIAVVSWGAQYGRSQSVSLSTIVSDFQNAIGGDTCSSILTGNWTSPSATNFLFGTLLGDTAGTYQISDVDAYQKRLYVAVDQASQTVGANSPTTAPTNDTSVGTLGWSNPDRAISQNDSYASRTMNATAITNYLKANNFGFSVPAGATILGITVEIEHFRNGGSQGEVKDNQVRIIKADGTFGTANKPNASNWATSDSDTYTPYGSTSDLWNEKWTSADINDSDFGVVIAAAGTSGSTNRVANVDHIRIAVTYRKQLYVLNATNPTVLTQGGQLSTATTTAPVDAGFKSVVIATSTATGAYAFVATNSTAGQLQVVNVGLTSPTIVNTYAISGAPAANTIFYKDGYVYLGLANNASGPEFYIIDVHNPFSIPALSGSNFTEEIGAGVNAIYVKNNKAYIATDDYSRELVVLDLSDLAHPAPFGTYDAPPSGSTTFGLGRSVYTVGDTLYFGRYYISNGPELAVLDTKTSALNVLGTNDIGVNASNAYGVYGVIARDNRAFVLTNAASGGHLKIMNITNPANVFSVATTTLPNAGGGVALDCEGNYLYAASLPQSGTFQNRGSITVVTAP